jgi:NADPH:quinone reductase-like Zn-dependent oxidoreductase
MRALVLKPYGRPDQVAFVETPRPVPPDAAFARARGMNFFMVFVFVHPDGSQLAEIGELLKAERIRPVIDKVFPFEQTKEALAYLENGRAKGKAVVQMR